MCEFCVQRKKVQKIILKTFGVTILGLTLSGFLQKLGKDFGLLGFCLTISALTLCIWGFAKEVKVLDGIEKRMRDTHGHTDQ